MLDDNGKGHLNNGLYDWLLGKSSVLQFRLFFFFETNTQERDIKNAPPVFFLSGLSKNRAPLMYRNRYESDSREIQLKIYIQN